MNKQLYYDGSQIVFAVALLAMSTATLIRVCRGRKFTFVVKLIVLLMLSSVAVISGSISNYEEFEAAQLATNTTFWLWMSGLSYAVHDASFNVAHWMFAFEYYSISRYMPYLLVKSTPSAGMIRCDERVYKVLMFFNVLAPVANGASLLMYNL